MENRHVDGLIVAAGLSSRMGEFKPLLPLNGNTMIENAADVLRPYTHELYVVTGKRNEEVEAVLRSREARFLYNENYAVSDMFESVRLGINAMSAESEGFFFLPGDVPLVSEYTIKTMLNVWKSDQTLVIQPTYRGKPGHPPFISAECYSYITHYSGDNGLRGALDFFKDKTKQLNTPDPAILLDADKPEDYNRLVQYAQNRGIPSLELCEDIWECFRTPKLVIGHSRKVTDVAMNIAMKLTQAGHALNLELVRVSALLHDIAKGADNKNHDSLGSEWLNDLGYPEVARVVASHTDLPEEALDLLDERAVVHLADKLVQGGTVVTLEQRFQKPADRYNGDEKAMEAIFRRKRIALTLQERIQALIQPNEKE